jgi:hypothetical protein
LPDPRGWQAPRRALLRLVPVGRAARPRRSSTVSTTNCARRWTAALPTSIGLL